MFERQQGLKATMSANNSVGRIAGAPSGTTTSKGANNSPISIDLTPSEAWALVSAIRPMSASDKECVDIAWVQQRIYTKLRERISDMH